VHGCLHWNAHRMYKGNQHNGKKQIKTGTCCHDRNTSPYGLMQERAHGVAHGFFIELLSIHLDIPAEGHKCQPIFGASPLLTPQGWTETDGKALNAYPRFFGNNKVAKFMHHNKRSKDNCEMYYGVEKSCYSELQNPSSAYANTTTSCVIATTYVL